MNGEQWRPSTNKGLLFARAELLKSIRIFFEQRSVLEVETSVLSQAAGTDPNLDSISASYQDPQKKEKTLFLQTSPEFAMKRLLANGSGAIFQICKAFRNAEQGDKHNPEFTLLEWYQPGYDEHQLMDEVMELLKSLYPSEHILQRQWQRITYQNLFEQHLGFNPHTVGLEQLEQFARNKIDIELKQENKDTWLDLLFSHLIEPELQEPVFIYDYPASQAALAVVEVNAEGQNVARRFELVINGMEIANGYFELTDAEEQRRRFSHDLEERHAQEKKINPIDENFLAAMDIGLPVCAGVAVGLDRLLMLISDTKSINDVLAFPLDRA